MMILGTPDMVVAAGRVLGRVGRSRDRQRQTDCSRLYDACHHTAGGVRERSGQALSTAVERCAAAAARQVWRGDEPEPDQDGPAYG